MSSLVRVCSVDDVPLGEGRALTLAGRRIALFRAESGWYAIDGECPHKGGPLADGILAERSVICPLHERRFDLETGAALTDGCGVGTHRVELREGGVFVQLRGVPASNGNGRVTESTRSPHRADIARA